MFKIKFNESNRKYYSDDFIKGFECGAERQYEADNKTGYWSLCRDDLFEWYECSECHYGRGGEMQDLEDVPRYCPHCGSFMENAYVEVEE